MGRNGDTETGDAEKRRPEEGKDFFNALLRYSNTPFPQIIIEEERHEAAGKGDQRSGDD
jgi:hypothetical protein